MPPAIFVDVTADVAEEALPVNAPTNVVDVTELNPANVVTVAPSATAVEPIVTELFVNALFGILVNDAPDPAKPVAVNIPDDGTKYKSVLEVLSGRLPVTAVVHTGYTAEPRAVSSIIVELEE